MENKRPRQYKKPFKKDDDQPKIWKSSPAGKKFADWQVKLKAISICMSNHNGEVIAEDVEKIYQDLIHRG